MKKKGLKEYKVKQYRLRSSDNHQGPAYVWIKREGKWLTYKEIADLKWVTASCAETVRKWVYKGKELDSPTRYSSEHHTRVDGYIETIRGGKHRVRPRQSGLDRAHVFVEGEWIDIRDLAAIVGCHEKSMWGRIDNGRDLLAPLAAYQKRINKQLKEDYDTPIIESTMEDIDEDHVRLVNSFIACVPMTGNPYRPDRIPTAVDMLNEGGVLH